jgi:hypothetical protein
MTPTGKPPIDGNGTGQARARITASVYCSVVRYTLGRLLDKLDELTGERES